MHRGLIALLMLLLVGPGVNVWRVLSTFLIDVCIVFASDHAGQRCVAGVNLRQPITGVLAPVCHSIARGVLQAGAGTTWEKSEHGVQRWLLEECRLLQSLEERASEDMRLHSPAGASTDPVGTHNSCCIAVGLACFTDHADSEQAMRLRGQHQQA